MDSVSVPTACQDQQNGSTVSVNVDSTCMSAYRYTFIFLTHETNDGFSRMKLMIGTDNGAKWENRGREEGRNNR